MRIRDCRFMVVALVAYGWLLAAGAAIGAGQAGPDLPAAVTMFNERMALYVTTRARLEEPLPLFDERRDAWSLMLTRRYLASAIRAARPAHRQGCIFSPLVADYVRVVIHQTLDAAALRPLHGPDDDDRYVPLVVHEPVPEWGMQTAPPVLIRALPSLPAGVEYRIVPPDLILWDTHAEILIDVLPRAFLHP